MISAQHKTVFVHVPKCAGQSVEMAFLADCGLTWETRDALLLKPNPDPERGPPRLAHLLGNDYVELGYISAETFRDWYTFAIVRNPFSRAVSLYRHLDLNMSFRAFSTDWLPDQFARGPEADQFWFVRPQSDFVTERGEIIVDDILRFEVLDQSFGKVVAATGLKTPLGHANSTGNRTPPDQTRKHSSVKRLSKAIATSMTPERRERHPDWRSYYDTATAAAVARLYADDIDRFAYPATPMDPA